ncbi:MAG: CRTAC1 family protein [bacterium]|nr:CRTAC1 family protein [bacterium]
MKPASGILFESVLVALLCAGCGGDGQTPGTGTGAGSNTGSSASDGWLVEVTAASGIDFVHHSGRQGNLVLTEIMGGGAALFDCDGDGDLDAFFVDGASDSARSEGDRSSTPNRLFRNDGSGVFTDATEGAGLAVPDGIGMGVCVGDVDGDGLDDLYVTQFGRDRLYHNSGGGRFEDVTDAYGVDVAGWSCSAAFFDADADGDLDLFVTQYIDLDLELECRDGAGRRTWCPPLSGAPVADVFLRNTGGRFVDESERVGIAAVRAAGLGVVCDDFDGDGRADVFVANDGYENHLWIGREDGTFRDEAVARGVAFNHLGAPEAGMGVVAEDLTGGGGIDLLLTHLQEETNTLYRARGGIFVDDTGRSGLFETTMAYTGFGIAAFDIELDGDLDLAIANGRVRAGIVAPQCELAAPLDVLAEPNLLLIGAGGRFADAAGRATAFTGPAEVSRGVCAGDLDGDGDVDLVVTQIDGPARVYRNDAPRAGGWWIVDAREPDGRRAIGARVTVLEGGARLARTVRAADGYVTSRDARAHFGLASGSTQTPELEVLWPTGEREQFTPAGRDRVVTLVRGEGREL